MKDESWFRNSRDLQQNHLNICSCVNSVFSHFRRIQMRIVDFVIEFFPGVLQVVSECIEKIPLVQKQGVKPARCVCLWACVHGKRSHLSIFFIYFLLFMQHSIVDIFPYQSALEMWGRKFVNCNQFTNYFCHG